MRGTRKVVKIIVASELYCITLHITCRPRRREKKGVDVLVWI